MTGCRSQSQGEAVTRTVSGAKGESMDTEGTHPFLAAQNCPGPCASDSALEKKVVSLDSPATAGTQRSRAVRDRGPQGQGCLSSLLQVEQPGMVSGAWAGAWAESNQEVMVVHMQRLRVSGSSQKTANTRVYQNSSTESHLMCFPTLTVRPGKGKPAASPLSRLPSPGHGCDIQPEGQADEKQQHGSKQS